MLAGVMTALCLASCDRSEAALQLTPGDPEWQRDSALIARRPALLLRVVRDTAPGRAPTRVIPIAIRDSSGLRALSMGDRGWRALDLTYLQSTAMVTPYRLGNALPALPIVRGMWEGAPFDTVPGCTALAPSAVVAADAETELMFAGAIPKERTMPEVSDADRTRILEDVATLIAPTAGVSMSQAARYRRSVYTAATGAHTTRTVIVVLTSPEIRPDTGMMMGQRPRQLIVVLDKGVYGYKPSYVFQDNSDIQVLPQRRYLGHFDADGDGVSELFFGLADARYPLVTYALRHENDNWRDWWSYERSICHAARR